MLQRIKDRRMAQDEGGFTLIELLVVIIILGILAAVVVFAVGGVGDKGQKAACKIDTRTIRTAQEAYAAQPTTATPAGGGGSYAGNTAALVTGGFLSETSKYHATTANNAVTPKTFAIQVLASACGNTSALTTPIPVGATTPDNYVDSQHPDNY